MNRTLLKFENIYEFSAAKKTYLFAFMLLGIVATAQQRTFTKSVSANYATRQVTFNISWAAGSRGTYTGKVYNSKVWVLVDYQEIQNGTLAGSWKRADIDLTKLPANCTADGTNAKGFWYQGQATAEQNATVTVTLKNVPAQFNWCAFASDCPPQAVYNGGSSFTFKGTAPFYVTYENESPTTVTTKSYSSLDKNVIAMTDATGCPAGCKMRNQAVSEGACCSGLTLVGGYCRDLVADNVLSYTGCGFEVKNKPTETSFWSESLCDATSGWHLPTNAQLQCMWSNRNYYNFYNGESIMLLWGSERAGNTGTCATWGSPCVDYTSSSGYIALFWYAYVANCDAYSCSRKAGTLVLIKANTNFTYGVCVR